MEKEFEALNEIINLITEDKKVKYKATILFCCKIIKQALTELKAIKEAKPSETLETQKDMLIGNGCNNTINDYVDNLILPIKQSLLKAQEMKKAIKIIFEKDVITLLLKLADNVNEYNERVPNGGKLTQKEFELLKEML